MRPSTKPSSYRAAGVAPRADDVFAHRAGDAQTGPHYRQAPHGIPGMVDISELPAEENDRAVPGAWEGDLVIGRRNALAIGTLVECQTGYVMLPHLPDGYQPEQVRDALTAKMQILPDVLRRSLTWDQGAEMRDWKHVRAAADHRHLLRRPTLTVAARGRREHEWPAAAVLSKLRPLESADR